MKKEIAIFFDRDGVLIEAPILDGKLNPLKSSKMLNFVKIY